MMQTNSKRFASEIKAAVVSRRRISIVADYAVFDAVKNYRCVSCAGRWLSCPVRGDSFSRCPCGHAAASCLSSAPLASTTPPAAPSAALPRARRRPALNRWCGGTPCAADEYIVACRRFPGECLLVGVFVDLQSALVYVWHCRSSRCAVRRCSHAHTLSTLQVQHTSEGRHHPQSRGAATQVPPEAQPHKRAGGWAL